VITTDSITRCWKRRLPSLAGVLLAVVLLLAFAVPAMAQPAHAEVTQLSVERSEDGLLLSAAMRFELPTPVEDALSKGIAMFFVAEAQVLQDRWYWYDKKVASASRHMRLSFQPLTRRWRLLISSSPIGNPGLALGQNFDSMEEALAAIDHISHWKIAEPNQIDADSRYSVEFRFRLDVSQLPRPFQIGAVGQADWNISASRTQRLVIEAQK
jgi:hypothetical protein